MCKVNACCWEQVKYSFTRRMLQIFCDTLPQTSLNFEEKYVQWAHFPWSGDNAQWLKNSKVGLSQELPMATFCHHPYNMKLKWNSLITNGIVTNLKNHSMIINSTLSENLNCEVLCFTQRFDARRENAGWSMDQENTSLPWKSISSTPGKLVIITDVLSLVISWSVWSLWCLQLVWLVKLLPNYYQWIIDVNYFRKMSGYV